MIQPYKETLARIFTLARQICKSTGTDHSKPRYHPTLYRTVDVVLPRDRKNPKSNFIKFKKYI